MVFSSIGFLFLFLPVSLFVYYLVPERGRNPVLAVFSILFYAWGGPENLIWLMFAVVFNYFAGLEIGGIRRSAAENRKTLRAITAATAAGDIALLAVFKYAVGTMPVGLSFYTFSVLSYIFDLYQGRAEAEKNFLHFLIYVSLFPKVLQGPIVQYADMDRQLAERKISLVRLAAGLRLFLVGLFKKVLIADALGAAFGALTGSAFGAAGDGALSYAGSAMADLARGSGFSVLSAWLGMIFYGLQLYFDFSGDSDMAIGLAFCFGFHFERNFNYPYCARSISEFWRRWHISLGNWFKQYVYFPMGGSRVSNRRLAFNLLTVWALTGIWHGNTWNFVLWGLWHGAFVMLDKFVIKDHFDALPKWVRALLTTFVAMLGWIFFFSPTIAGAFGYFGALFGFGGRVPVDKTALYTLRGNLLLLIAAAVGATPLVDHMYRRVFYYNRLHIHETVLRVIAAAGYLLLFVSCVAAILSSSYQTFLYFQF